jgi:hypothetical protein
MMPKCWNKKVDSLGSVLGCQGVSSEAGSGMAVVVVLVLHSRRRVGMAVWRDKARCG